MKLLHGKTQEGNNELKLSFFTGGSDEFESALKVLVRSKSFMEGMKDVQ